MDGELDAVYNNIKVILIEIEIKDAGRKEFSEEQERKIVSENSLVMRVKAPPVDIKKSRKFLKIILMGRHLATYLLALRKKLGRRS